MNYELRIGKTKNIRRKNFVSFGLVAVMALFFFCNNIAHASDIVFSSAPPQIGVGNTVSISVRLHSPDQPINVVGLNISYPSALLEYEGFKDGNSIISAWVTKPEASGGVVVLNGLIAGGFQDTDGLVATLEFKALASGDASINLLPSSETYINDGNGTLAQLSPSALAVSIAPSGFIGSQPEIADNFPPEPFTPIIGRSPDIFSDKYFVSFSAQDKGTGVEHYEVKEGASGAFVRAESPYLLSDQTLSKDIFVKAVDWAGNERVATVSAMHPEKNTLPALMLLGFCILVVLLFIVRRLFHAKT